MKKILVAIDSCESTTIASPIVERTIELANAFSSKVWILHVVPRSHPTSFNIDNKTMRREAADELHHEHEFLQHLARCLQERGVDATAHLVPGATTGTILKEAERLDTDLIVLGCHRHSQLYGAVMDGTEEGLLSKCSYPIMFVPVAER